MADVATDPGQSLANHVPTTSPVSLASGNPGLGGAGGQSSLRGRLPPRFHRSGEQHRRAGEEVVRTSGVP